MQAKTDLILEIACYSVQSLRIAAMSGADRVELCAGFFEGGVTPSIGKIERAIKEQSVPVYVMIRPRGGDFCYTDEAFKIMERDIAACEKAGAAGVVFGMLLPNGSIDIIRVKQMVELAYPMDVTFHRAFDVSANLFESIDAIASCGITRVLTSGGYNKAIDGIDVLSQLVQYSAGRVQIMAGSGVNHTNLARFYNIGITQYHASASKFVSSTMQYDNPMVLFEQFPGMRQQLQIADEQQINAMRNEISKLKTNKIS